MALSQRLKIHLTNALVRVHEKFETKRLHKGICHELETVIFYELELGLDDRAKIEDWIEIKMKKWKHFSGSMAYPIPATENLEELFNLDKDYWNDYDLEDLPRERARFIYNEYCPSFKNMWTGEYGNLRLDLLTFLLEEIIKEL